MERTLQLQDETDLKQVLLRKKEFDQLNKEAKRALESGDYHTGIDRLVVLVTAHSDKAVLRANLARAYAGRLDQQKALAEADAAAALDAKRFSNLRQELQKRMLPDLGQEAMYDDGLRNRVGSLRGSAGSRSRGPARLPEAWRCPMDIWAGSKKPWRR